MIKNPHSLQFSDLPGNVDHTTTPKEIIESGGSVLKVGSLFASENIEVAMMHVEKNLIEEVRDG